MNGVNFIPRHRRDASARRARLRAWTRVASAYALLCVVAVAISGIAGGGDDHTFATELAQLPGEIEASQRALSSLQAQLAEAQAKLDAARAIARQPDWSVLLGLLAQSLGDDIVLTTCKLEAERAADGPGGGANPRANGLRAPSAAAGAGAGANSATAAAAAPGARFRLELSGLGRSQTSVSQFVLRLEQLGVFERVTIVKTGREMFGEHESIGFRLEAIISASEGGGT